MRAGRGTVTVQLSPAFSPGNLEQVVQAESLMFDGWNKQQTYANFNLLTLHIEHESVIT